jgi:16S rRNA pseudouridine516 synthase
MRLAHILFTQGFGTRRDCAGLAASGLVRVGERVLTDPDEELDPQGLVLSVQGQEWPVHDKAVVLLHKPAGYECSTKPKHWPSVLSLLPAPLRTRGVQPVGRLDADTTGLLLLTDDGALIHQLSSPKRHVAKVYEAVTARPVAPQQLQQLLRGVVLNDDPAPVRAAAAVATGECALQLTLTEGKYHQVKRMVAAVGNHVERLHRSRMGALALPANLAPGQWCFLDAAQVAQAKQRD